MTRHSSVSREGRSDDELRAALTEQIGFIASSSEAYDRGELNEAKRMAVNIRVLLHETKRSHALLRQLGMIDKLAFVDGGEVPNPRNISTTTGLTGMHMFSNESGFHAEWVPKFGMPDYPRRAYHPFAYWWNRVVIVDSQDNRFSRKDLVLVMANQDGGAHFDPYLDKAYRQLTRQNSAGWGLVGPSGSRPITGVEFASVRQIAWELTDTLAERRELPP